MIRNEKPQSRFRRLALKIMYYRFAALALMVVCAIAWVSLDWYLDSVSPLSRRFLEDADCKPEAGEECPPPNTMFIKANPRENGQEWLVVFYTLGVLYMFIGLAIVCDEYFVPSLEVIAEKLELSPDVSGATLMAAGGSAPELFTSAIGTFSKSSVGFGTITGSAVFNVLFVIAMCALYAEEPLKLTWWPLTRDCTYYIFGLSILALFFVIITPKKILWWESLILLSLYFGYVYVMYMNVRLHKWVCETFNIDDDSGESIGEEHVNFNQPSTFRAGILSLLIKERSIMETIPYRIVTQIHGNLESTFIKFDENGDGKISKEELRNVFHALSVFSKEEETKCDDIFTILDTDGNGFVSYDEFKKWYIKSEYRIENEMKMIFEKFDVSGDGQINHTELKQLLIEAGVSEDEVFAQQQRIQRMSTFVQAALPGSASLGDLDGFRQKDSTLPVEIKQSEKADLDAHNAFVEVTKCAANDDVQLQEMNSLGHPTNPKKHQLSEIWNEQESISFAVFQQWYKDEIFYQKQKDAELEAEHAITLQELLAWPHDSGFWGRFWFCLVLPLMIGFYLTIPDTRSYKRSTLFWAVGGFANSIVWIGIFSVFMVDWVTWIGFTVGAPDVVMGVTFIAAGTSIPDLLSSVIVAKKGFGDMAVSSSIGSNIFDILVGLPLPWLVFSLVENCPVYVQADNLQISIFVLLGMVIAVVCMIVLSGWLMTKKLGACMFFFYLIFLATDLPLADWSCV